MFKPEIIPFLNSSEMRMRNEIHITYLENGSSQIVQHFNGHHLLLQLRHFTRHLEQVVRDPLMFNG